MATAGKYLPSGILAQDVNGAKVLKACMVAGTQRAPGDNLTEEEFNSIPLSNRNALINLRYLMTSAKVGGDKYVVPRSDGKYDIVFGSKINGKPLTLEEAERAMGVAPESTEPKRVPRASAAA